MVDVNERDSALRQETAALDALERRPAPAEGPDGVYAPARAAYDAVVGELGFLAAPAAPPPALRDRLLRRIGREVAARARDFPVDGRPAGAEAVLPGVFAVRSSSAEWIPTPVAGVAYKVLGRDPAEGRTTRLVRFSPGMRYPKHRHAGVEEIYIIEGELCVNGASLKAGDYCRSEPGTEELGTFTDVGALAMVISSDADEVVVER
jgi:anti-sigma factor ChrR (cupin superfamily)